MDFKEAQAKIQAKKPKDNYMVVTMGYDNKIVLPYKDGVAFLAAIASAEQLSDPYNQPHSICELDRSKISFTPISYQEYERYKVSMLLQIPLSEVKEFYNQTI